MIGFGTTKIGNHHLSFKLDEQFYLADSEATPHSYLSEYECNSTFKNIIRNAKDGTWDLEKIQEMLKNAGAEDIKIEDNGETRIYFTLCNGTEKLYFNLQQDYVKMPKI